MQQLKPCLKCGTPVNKKSKKCEKCGRAYPAVSNWQSAAVLLGMCFLLYLIGSAVFGKNDTHDINTSNPRSYQMWIGARQDIRINMAGAQYSTTSNNILPDDYDLLFKNNMAELDLRAKKIVKCGLETPRLNIDESADYFSAIIAHCMEKLGM